MRISTSTIYDSSITGIQDQMQNLFTVQQQLSSGLRINTPKDDPVGAAQVVEINQQLAQNDQFNTNATQAGNILKLQEASLNSVVTDLQDLKQTTVQAADGALTNSDRAALAANVQEKLNDIMNLANSTDGYGGYLFGGYKGNQPPYAQSANGVVYQGDYGQRLAQISTGRQIPVTDVGADVFDNIKNAAGNFTVATGSATHPTNSGSGTISVGSVANAADPNIATPLTVQFANRTVVNGSSATYPTSGALSFTINGKTVSSAGPLADANAAATLINNTAGTGVTASVVNGNLQLVSASGAPITLAESASGNLSALGLAAGTTSPSLVYDVVDANTGQAVKDAGGNAMTNLTYTAGATITADGKSFAISGTPAAGDTFSVRPVTQQSLFATLSQFAALLNAPVTTANQAAYNTSLQNIQNNLDNAIDHLSTQLAINGSRQNTLNSTTSEDANNKTLYTAALSNVQSTDFVRASTQLSQYQVGLQAAEKSFMTVQGLSLFNYITSF